MQNEQFPSDLVPINRAKVESIDLYEVTDDELSELEKGKDGGLFLNLALFLISASISFLITLTTTNIESDRQFILFCVIAISGLVGAVILSLLWWRERNSVKDVIRRIRARMKSPGEDIEVCDTETDKQA